MNTNEPYLISMHVLSIGDKLGDASSGHDTGQRHELVAHIRGRKGVDEGLGTVVDVETEVETRPDIACSTFKNGIFIILDVK